MADGHAHYPRSSQQPAQTISSASRRDASLEVQCPLQNEQGDNLEQSKKNTISTFFLFLHAQKWVAGVDECRIEADACHALPIWRPQPGMAFKSQSMRSAMDLHLLPFLLGIVRDRAMTWNTFLEICSYLQAPQCDWLTVALFFFFFFFFYCRSHSESGPNPLPPL